MPVGVGKNSSLINAPKGCCAANCVIDPRYVVNSATGALHVTALPI